MPASLGTLLPRLEDFSRLVFCNPFIPERREIEARLLGTRRPGVWAAGQDSRHLAALQSLAEQTLAAITPSMQSRIDPVLLEDLAFYVLYYRHVGALQELIQGKPVNLRPLYQSLVAELSDYSITFEPAEVLGCFFQIRRAFEGIYGAIVGSTPVAAQLRASIWESIFTHQPRRFWKTLLHRAADFPTLIAGPSGTGKELVARAIAMGRFIPYNVRRGEFEFRFDELLHPLNLAALSPTLIESELFGHRRGAFTGALEDRIGWLEACQDRGVVFLDEIGELEASLQVKLLRVLQEKTFQRIGETKPRLFRGKIIAATNRDLAEEMQAGRFRRDLYYRLCADIIQTPSLAELIGADRDELRGLLSFIAAKLLPDPPPLAASRINTPSSPTSPDQRTQLVNQTLDEIQRHVGWDYAWPGNFRELEQCTRNVLIRGRYIPLKFHAANPSLTDSITNLDLTADQLLTAYCRHAYEKLGSYRRAADHLKLDRRTLRARVHKPD